MVRNDYAYRASPLQIDDMTKAGTLANAVVISGYLKEINRCRREIDDMTKAGFANPGKLISGYLKEINALSH